MLFRSGSPTPPETSSPFPSVHPIPASPRSTHLAACAACPCPCSSHRHPRSPALCTTNSCSHPPCAPAPLRSPPARLGARRPCTPTRCTYVTNPPRIRTSSVDPRGRDVSRDWQAPCARCHTRLGCPCCDTVPTASDTRSYTPNRPNPRRTQARTPLHGGAELQESPTGPAPPRAPHPRLRC